MPTSTRMIRTIAATLPLAALMGAAPAWADPTIYYHAGNWHAFTDKDVQGTAVCGIATSNPTDGRSLSLTFTVGGTDLTVNADKPTWNIPDPTAIDAAIQVDQNPVWPAQAVGHGTATQWTIPAANIRAFDTQFRNGSTMTVSFPAGNEAPWVLSLSGSTASSATLWRCVQDLTDRARANAPAASAGPPSQPYGQAATPAAAPAPAAPTQPFAAGAAPAAAPTQATAPTSAPTPAPASTTPAVPTPPADTSSTTPAPTAIPPAPPPTTKP